MANIWIGSICARAIQPTAFCFGYAWRDSGNRKFGIDRAVRLGDDVSPGLIQLLAADNLPAKRCCCRGPSTTLFSKIRLKIQTPSMAEPALGLSDGLRFSLVCVGLPQERSVR